MAERYQYDPPKLSRDEATELCVYHLRCAAALFQLVPDDYNKSILAEINRTCDEEVQAEPAKLWADLILRLYEKMKEND